MEALKRQAAIKALELVHDDMRLGLGTGSTAAHFVTELGARVAAGLKVVCVPTSEATRRQADALNIPLTDLNAVTELDMTVDGADEINPQLDLIKGGGGAHMREKIVASASRQLIVIADGSKCVAQLGKFPLPLEVATFGANATIAAIKKICEDSGIHGMIRQRRDTPDTPFISDNGNLIFDGDFGAIPDAPLLARQLETVPGLVAHGLFINIATMAIIAREAGVEVISRPHIGAP